MLSFSALRQYHLDFRSSVLKSFYPNFFATFFFVISFGAEQNLLLVTRSYFAFYVVYLCMVGF